MNTQTLQAPRDDERARLELVAVAAGIGVFAALIFVGWPEIDLTVSSWFNLGPRHFLLHDYSVATDIRLACQVITGIAGGTALVGIVLARAAKRCLLGLGIAQWLFLTLVVGLGPGLVVNVVLKDHWHRPRPINIVEFGGPDQFTPVLERSGQCDRNCSFVCGESSSIYALGFAVALLARRRRALMGLAVIAGSLIGVIRIGEGGHFLSDVVFSAVFMAMVVALLHWFISHPFFRGLRLESADLEGGWVPRMSAGRQAREVMSVDAPAARAPWHGPAILCSVLLFLPTFEASQPLAAGRRKPCLISGSGAVPCLQGLKRGARPD